MARAALIVMIVFLLVGAGAKPAPAQCIGDCDANGAVAVAELVSGVAMALARNPIGTCPAFDADADLGVSVDELVLAVGFALRGCPPGVTPTATPTSCGDPAVTERYGRCSSSDNEADCLSAGGEWGPYPFSGMLGCFCPTGQGGCGCRRGDDCVGLCTAPLGPQPCDSVQMGTCTAVSPVAGCLCVFLGDALPSGLCIDP